MLKCGISTRRPAGRSLGCFETMILGLWIPAGLTSARNVLEPFEQTVVAPPTHPQINLLSPSSTVIEFAEGPLAAQNKD